MGGADDEPTVEATGEPGVGAAPGPDGGGGGGDRTDPRAAKQARRQARGEAEEEADRAARPVAPPVVDDGRGSGIITASWVGTGLFTVVAVAATASVGAFQVPLIAVSVVLFVVGFAAFFAAYVIAIGRSREDLVGMGGLYFLAGSAPPRVRRHLMGSFAAEVVVATVTASVGLSVVAADAGNPLAFGFLVPLYGLGLAGLWGARHGTFPPRPVDPDAGRAATR